jgi:hypothetical protein
MIKISVRKNSNFVTSWLSIRILRKTFERRSAQEWVGVVNAEENLTEIYVNQLFLS